MSKQTTGPGWSIKKEAVGSGWQQVAGWMVEPSSEGPAFLCSSQTERAGAAQLCRRPEIRGGQGEGRGGLYIVDPTQGDQQHCLDTQ